MKNDIGRRFSDVTFSMDEKLNIVEANRSFLRLFDITDYKINLGQYLCPTDAEHLQVFLSTFDEKSDTHQFTATLHLGTSLSSCLFSFKREDKFFHTTIKNLKMEQQLLEAVLLENREYRTILNKIDSFYFTFNGEYYRLKNTRDFISIFEGGLEEFRAYFVQFFKLQEVKDCTMQIDNLFKDITAGDVEKTYKLLPKEGPFISVNTLKFSTREGTVCIALITTGKKIVLTENSYSEKHDGLTNLYNKLTITQLIKNRIDMGKKPGTLFMIDVDNFKECNDNYGHAFGDTVLVTFANVLQESIGNHGIVGRMGGDEFIAYIDYTEEDDIRNIARSIKLGIQWGVQAVKPESVVTCSIGAVRVPLSADTYDGVFNLADKCLYIAKSRGRNCYIIYKPAIHDKIIAHMDENMVQNQTGQAVMTEALSEVAILQYLQNKGPNYLRLTFEMLVEFMQVHRISLFRKNPETKKWELDFISGSDGNSEPRLKCLKRGYFKYFNSYGFLHMDNVNALDTLDKTRFNMYLSDNIASTLEILIRDSEGVERALICFDVFKPARTFQKTKVIYALMISKLLANEL